MNYQLVQLKNGTYSVRSLADAETFHPVIGPVAEAEALYIRQLRLLDRIAKTAGEFTVWDVGLGAAANAMSAILCYEAQAAAGPVRPMHLISFENDLDALRLEIADHMRRGAVVTEKFVSGESRKGDTT